MEKKTFAEKLDYVFNKLLPKKLIVVIISTIIVFKEIAVPAEYWYILMVYVGGNVIGKFVSVFKGKEL